jgi:hypothetical protein
MDSSPSLSGDVLVDDNEEAEAALASIAPFLRNPLPIVPAAIAAAASTAPFFMNDLRLLFVLDSINLLEPLAPSYYHSSR